MFSINKDTIWFPENYRERGGVSVHYFFFNFLFNLGRSSSGQNCSQMMLGEREYKQSGVTLIQINCEDFVTTAP